MSSNRWMDKEDVVHIYNGILLDHKIMPFAATWMNLEVIILREVRKIKTNTIRHHLRVECKTWHRWTPMKQKAAQIQRTALGWPKGRRGGAGEDWESGILECKLPHIEQINKAPHSTGHHAQHPVINHNGKEYGKEYKCVPWNHSAV